ncbi:hypothetical protein N9Y92_03905 [Chlamydiales bacterium]|nr:hypothetical protein [Chlamydiales bacterium]
MVNSIQKNSESNTLYKKIFNPIINTITLITQRIIKKPRNVVNADPVITEKHFKFSELSHEIKLLVASFLSPKDLITLSKVNRVNNQLVSSSRTCQDRISTEKVLRLFRCPSIIEALGGIEKFKKIPTLELKNRKNSDYIDFIKSKELTSSIMRGVDNFKRPFITFCLNRENGSNQNAFVTTIFQRYSDQNRLWVWGGQYRFSEELCLRRRSFYSNAEIDKEPILDRIRSLALGETVPLTEDPNDTTKRITLFNPATV